MYKPYLFISFCGLVLAIALSMANMAPLYFFRPVVVQRVEVVPPDPALLRVGGHIYGARLQNGDQLYPATSNLSALKAVSAESGEAPRNNHALNILVVDFSRSSPQSPDTPTEIGLDLSEMGDAGALIVSNGPVVWAIRDARPGARAKIAFESEAPIAVRNAPSGIVAGFHVGAFGDFNVVTPQDYLHRDNRWRFQQFCASMQEWSNYFGVPYEDIRLWTYDPSPAFHLRSTAISADGRELNWPKSIAIECAPPPAPPKDPPPLPIQRVRRRFY